MVAPVYDIATLATEWQKRIEAYSDAKSNERMACAAQTEAYRAFRSKLMERCGVTQSSDTTLRTITEYRIILGDDTYRLYLTGGSWEVVRL